MGETTNGEVKRALDLMSNAIWKLKQKRMCDDDQPGYDATIQELSELLTGIYKAVGVPYKGYNWELAGKKPEDVL